MDEPIFIDLLDVSSSESEYESFPPEDETYYLSSGDEMPELEYMSDVEESDEEVREPSPPTCSRVNKLDEAIAKAMTAAHQTGVVDGIRTALSCFDKMFPHVLASYRLYDQLLPALNHQAEANVKILANCGGLRIQSVAQNVWLCDSSRFFPAMCSVATECNEP